MRWLLVMALSVSGVAVAQGDLTSCTDEFEDCQENCSLRFGISTKDSERAKLASCFGKCKSAESLCRDRFLETKRNSLDDGALEEKKRKRREYRERQNDVEAFRDDGKHADPDPDEAPPPRAQKPKDGSKKKSSSKPPPEEVAEEEAPKRTATRVSDLEPAKPVSKPIESQPAQETASAKPVAEEPVARAPQPVEEPPPPPPKKKEPEKKKEEKRRALDEWDPDAL